MQTCSGTKPYDIKMCGDYGNRQGWKVDLTVLAYLWGSSSKKFNRTGQRRYHRKIVDS